MNYVDGYVLPVPKKNIEAYRKMAQKAARVWRDHGALEYWECVGEDLKTKMGTPFLRAIKTRANMNDEDMPLRHEAHELRRVQGDGGCVRNQKDLTNS